MKKNIICLGIAAFILTAASASAETIFTTKSPMYNTVFGTGIGGYNAIHNVGAGVESAQAVQATSEEWSNKEEDKSVTIKESATEPNFVPTSTNLGSGEGYSYEKGKDGYIYGYAEGGEQGVNQTKTIYTDGIGRLHFFGKGSRFKTKD